MGSPYSFNATFWISVAVLGCALRTLIKSLLLRVNTSTLVKARAVKSTGTQNSSDSSPSNFPLFAVSLFKVWSHRET